MTDVPELTERDFSRAIKRSRLVKGQAKPSDIAALRAFVRLTQEDFAQALGISVYTLRNWEQGRRKPEGRVMALLRIAARHPQIIRENVATAA